MAEETPPELAAFCRDRHPWLVGVLGLYLGDVDVAEELAQEALVRTARRWGPRLRNPVAFAYRTAMNLANSHLRRQRAERRALQRIAGGQSATHVDPDSSAVLTVRDELHRLPKGQRQAVALRHGSELTVTETAAVLGLSEEAVRSSCKRGLAQLRARLDQTTNDITQEASPDA